MIEFAPGGAQWTWAEEAFGAVELCVRQLGRAFASPVEALALPAAELRDTLLAIALEREHVESNGGGGVDEAAKQRFLNSLRKLSDAELAERLCGPPPPAQRPPASRGAARLQLECTGARARCTASTTPELRCDCADAPARARADADAVRRGAPRPGRRRDGSHSADVDAQVAPAPRPPPTHRTHTAG